MDAFGGGIRIKHAACETYRAYVTSKSIAINFRCENVAWKDNRSRGLKDRFSPSRTDRRRTRGSSTYRRMRYLKYTRARANRLRYYRNPCVPFTCVVDSFCRTRTCAGGRLTTCTRQHTRMHLHVCVAQTDVLANMTGADAHTCRNVRAGCAEYVAGAYSHPRICTRGI